MPLPQCQGDRRQWTWKPELRPCKADGLYTWATERGLRPGNCPHSLHVSGEPHSRLKPERPATAELERLHVQAEAEGFCPTGMKGSWAGASQKEGGRKGNTLSSFRNDEWGHRQAALGQQGAAELV